MRPRDPNFDAEQDAELRAVPVPEGLVDRLRRTALADDEGLDAAVRGVPLPDGLVARLRRSILADDEAIDAAVRDVLVPVDLWGRLRRVPKGRLRLARLTRWATATSLVLGIGLSYVGAIVALLLLAFPSRDVSRPKLVTDWEVEFSDPAEQAVGMVAQPDWLDDGRPPDDGMPKPPAYTPEVVLVKYVDPASGRFDAAVNPLGSVDPLLDASPWGALGSNPTIDPDIDDLKKWPPPVPKGIAWPLVPSAKLGFLIEFGVHPFVSPVDPQLRTIPVPLGVDSSSYELMRRYLEDGELPKPAAVRTEEFLAAADYDFPRPRNRPLELSVAAGPSPFAFNFSNFDGEAVRMFQVGVQAREIRNHHHRPTYLIPVVDVSASMRLDGRLDMVRRALEQMGGYLGPEDRVSLIAFSEEAELVVEDCGAEDAPDLAAAVRSLAVQSSTNLAAGLQRAYAAVPLGTAAEKTAVRIVLLTDGQAELGRGTAELIEQRLGEAAGRQVLLDVIDLGRGEEVDRQLASFAEAGGGKIRHAANADQVRWAMLEILTGRSQLVAADVQLRVTFNPKTVLEYRLLGHEADLAGLNPADPQADFHAGQSATALYEVRLKKGGSGSRGAEVASVELTYRAPTDGQSRTLTRRLRRNQFASTFLQSPLSLQQAVLVAQAAEVLRKSPFGRVPEGRVRPGGRSLALVLELAGQVDTQLRERRWFVEFVSLVERAEGKRPTP